MSSSSSSSSLSSSSLSSKKITLKSLDGVTFEVEKVVAMKSGTIKRMVEVDCVDSNVIPLPNLTSNILAKVIEYCKKHVEVATAGENEIDSTAINDWDANFIKVEYETLFDLIHAANYLDIQGLIDLACQVVANMLIGKSPNEICNIFNITNDYTPEEEEEIRREYQWAF